MRVFSTTSVRLNPQINLSHAKINLAFGASYLRRKPIYFTFAKASLSLSLSLMLSNILSSLRHSLCTDSDTQLNMGELTASENTFITVPKLACLPSFNQLNFRLLHTHTHTHISRQRADTYSAPFSSYTFIHAHTFNYDFITLSLSTANTCTYRYVQTTLTTIQLYIYIYTNITTLYWLFLVCFML